MLTLYHNLRPVLQRCQSITIVPHKTKMRKTAKKGRCNATEQSVASRSLRIGYSDPEKFLSSGRRFKMPAAYNREMVDEVYGDELQQNKERFIFPALNNQRESVFEDPHIDKFLNMSMYEGRRSSAKIQLNKVFLELKVRQLQAYNKETPEERKDIECNPRELLKRAIEIIRPSMSTVVVRKGGIPYQVPVPLSPSKSYFYARKWLVEAGRDKTGLTKFYKVLADEILAANRGEGKCIKKKVDLHRLCEANKAFAHYM